MPKAGERAIFRRKPVPDGEDYMMMEAGCFPCVATQGGVAVITMADFFRPYKTAAKAAWHFMGAIGQRCGTCRRTLYRGARTSSTLAALAYGFGISVEELVEGTEVQEIWENSEL